MNERPLSPHLQIYRPQISSVTSIFHRISGIVLSVGAAFMVAWLWAAAYNSGYFVMWRGFFGSILGQIMLIGWSVAFYYHLGNGLRHLWWDTGNGFDLKTADKTGYFVFGFTALATLITWLIIWS
ncbi:MAG: succinate dehydrogenase, cytochrome b556 subunit [Alphaproteobacteria bacterium]|nr:succinate dehydrogenase, cytochrome b556 subunit [Alphaproteobacteria bacterium]